MTGETAFVHVTSRGNNRATIFADEIDYISFVRDLAVERRWRCHAYCLMPNHLHLLVEAEAGDLPSAMHRLKGRYARRFNARHGRNGHVFEGPYRRTRVECDEHLLEAARYIVLNPVRAGLCGDPAEWPWSSYAVAVDRERAETFVTTAVLHGLAGGAEGFRAFVAAGEVGRLQPG